jgi:hypothetical protein
MMCLDDLRWIIFHEEGHPEKAELLEEKLRKKYGG